MTWRCLFPPPGKAKLLEFPSLGWAKNWTRRQCFVCAVLESVYVGWSELRLTATLFTHTWRSQRVALGLPVSDLRWGKPSGRLVLPPCNYILPSCDKNTNMLHLKHCGGEKMYHLVFGGLFECLIELKCVECALLCWVNNLGHRLQESFCNYTVISYAYNNASF